MIRLDGSRRTPIKVLCMMGSLLVFATVLSVQKMYAPPAGHAAPRRSLLMTDSSALSSDRDANTTMTTTDSTTSTTSNASTTTVEPTTTSNGTDWANVDCAHFSSAPDACELVTLADNCQPDSGFINYLTLPYCVLHNVPGACILFVLWIAFLFIALGSTAEDYFCPALSVISETLKLSHNVAGVTFLALGNGAPDIFSVYSSIMNTKGVGQGTALALGELFGAGCFVTTVVVGTISVLVPFRVTRRPFIRDMVVYLVACLWTYVVLWDGAIHIFESLGYIVIYVMYVLVVIFGRKLYQSNKKMRQSSAAAPTVDPIEAKREVARTEELMPSSSFAQQPSQHNDSSRSRQPTPPPVIFVATVEEDDSTAASASGGAAHAPAKDADSISLRSVTLTPRTRRAIKAGNHDFSPALTSAVLAGAPAASIVHGGLDFHLVVNHGHHHHLHHHHHGNHQHQQQHGHIDGSPANNLLSVNHAPTAENDDNEEATESDPLLSSRLDALPVESPLQKFLAALVPINADEFMEAKWYGKIYAIFAVPITLCLTVTVPVVDYEEEDQNWNKYLQTLQCFTAPLFFVFGANIWAISLGGVMPLWALALILGGLLSTFVLVATKQDKPPRFQMLFSFLGFFVAVVWIYIIANEIVNLLQALGRILTISDAILGLTVLAWGNSVGDFVSNVTVAKQGFPGMGIGACFGSPAMNILIGLGVACTAACTVRQNPYPIESNLSLQVSGGFLLASLVSTLFFIPFNKFASHKYHGIYLLVLYASFMIVSVTLQFVT